MLAGLFVALGFATRPPWLVIPLFFFELVRVVGGWRALRTADGRRALAQADAAVRRCRSRSVGLILAALNAARFGSPFEFGHKFLAVQWQERMFRFGLFNYHFLSRNLAAALILLPRLMTHYPYVKISQHGMSMLVTSPNLAYTVMPQAPQSAATRAVADDPDDGAAVAALSQLGLRAVRLSLQPRLPGLLHGPARDQQPAADEAVPGPGRVLIRR